MRDGAHGIEHVFQQAPANGVLGKLGGDVQAADQTFLIFEDVEGITGGNAVLKGDAARQGVGVEKALDEFECATVVPMQFVTPVPGFFFEKRPASPS